VTYDKFNLRVVPDGEGFTVLADSPEGRAADPLLLPESLDHRPTPPPLVQQAAAELMDHCPGASRPPTPPVVDLPPKRVGSQLFLALFPGPVRHLFDRSLGKIAARPDGGLLIRLQLDPREGRLRHLHGLPWELLYCDETREFLGLDRRTPFVRCLDTPQPARPLSLGSPLRVLVVMANPSGTSPLDLAGEHERIDKAHGSNAGVHLSFFEHATREGLRLRLREESFHIVHFMGHGGFDDSRGVGALLFESPNGRPDPVEAETFAALFSGREQPNLVILNGCDTARSAVRPDLDPLRGVAFGLVFGGLPAVLAMRSGIRDRAAIKISEELYRRFALGDPIEAAVSEVRLALHTAYSGSADWSIPALFLREEPVAAPPRTAFEQTEAQSTSPSPHAGFIVTTHGNVEKQTNIFKAGKVRIDVK